MGRMMHYLVNVTRKEFCSVDLRRPLFPEIERVFAQWNWTPSDMLYIESQDEAKGSDLWDELTMNRAYKDMDYDEVMRA